MEISKRNKIIIAVVGGVIILALVIWYILSSRMSSNVNIEEPTPTATTTPEKTLQETFEENFKNIQPKYENDQVPIVTASRRFAERLGSYSINSRDVDAIAEINPLVTAKAKQLVGAYYDNLSATAEFSGISTMAMAVNNVKVSDDTATAEVLLIRKEFDTQGNEIRQYQDQVTLELIKIGQDWLVDNFVW